VFTGIITDVGVLQSSHRQSGGEWGDTRMRISCNYDVETIEIGASISHNGACMTVVTKGKTSDSPGGWYEFDVSDESLSKTTMGAWNIGKLVNLERAMTAKDELGGHLVTGHIDQVVGVLETESIAGSRRIRFELPGNYRVAIAPKGSVCIDGVSLTVNKVGADWFEVNIIPHTLEVTTLRELQAGSKVNLEIDLIARYVGRYLSQMESVK